MTQDNLPAVFSDGQLAARFRGLVESGQLDNSDLSAGVGQGFGVISIKASKFRVKYKGEEYPVTDQNGDPVPSLECVIIKANPNITKQFYAHGYVEGEASPPDCYSLDGKTPAAEVQAPQHTNCAACPRNQFGSRVTDNGKKAKACSDTRRLAIVPLSDLRNEAFGGPMLLRIPPSALKGLQMYGDLLKSRGYPYFAVATRIGFDIEASHPLPTFRPIRPLTDEEAEVVLELAASDITERVLADFVAQPAAAEAAKPAESDEVFEQPAPPNAVKPAAPAPAAAPAPKAVVLPTPKAAPKPAAPAAPAPKPVAAVKVAAPAKPPAPKAAPKAAPAPTPAPAPDSGEGDDLDADIRNILAGLSAAQAE